MGEMEITSRLVGPFNLANILAAAATALGLGLSPEDGKPGASRRLRGVPGRLERFGPAGGPAVFVDYAHTPAAIAQALGALQHLNFARIITVFGCGGDRDRKKRPLMGQAAAAGLAIGGGHQRQPPHRGPPGHHPGDRAGSGAGGLPKLPRPAAANGAQSGYLVVPDRREAIRLAVSLARPGDAVLVAGKGHEDYQIWGTERRHFDDREEVAEALKEYHG